MHRLAEADFKTAVASGEIAHTRDDDSASSRRHSKRSSDLITDMEAVIFVGIQGAGKSTFYKVHFFDTHVRINLDMLKTRHRERLLLEACIAAKQSFVVDNTNATTMDRQRYLVPAKQAGFQLCAFYFDVDPADAQRRNAARTGRRKIPRKAVYSTHRRLEKPSYDEGFDRIYRVTIDSNGTFHVVDVERNEDSFTTQ